MNNRKAVHEPQKQFPIVDGCLAIGGISLARLVKRVGCTPFYAYDRELISSRVRDLRQMLPGEVALHYSIKANPMPALVQHMSTLVDGFDVASGGELTVALDTVVGPENISFTGPGKSAIDLERAVAAGVVIHVESERQLDMIADLANRLGVSPKVMVRVNPDFDIKASGMRMGGGSKPFGIDVEEVPRLLKRILGMGVEFEGLHLFCGAQNLRAELIIEEKTRTLELAMRVALESPMPIKVVNMGGGFGIPYFPGDAPLDVKRIGDHLDDFLPKLRSELPTAKLVLELGRYLVGEAGIYVARVIDRKISRGEVYLVTDGGLHHHLAASGNFGQVIRRNYPIAIGNKMTAEERETVSVVGPLCTPLDVLGHQVELAHADVGDLVVVFQSGAYGLSASPTQFLGHPAPVEVLV